MNSKDKRKLIYAMIFGYSLGLIAQLINFSEKNSEEIAHDHDLFSIGDLGIYIATGWFFYIAFREKEYLLKVIFILATIPFVFNFSLLYSLHNIYFYLTEIAGTIVLIILMILYLTKK
jgi:hypothetical protein